MTIVAAVVLIGMMLSAVGYLAWVTVGDLLAIE